VEFSAARFGLRWLVPAVLLVLVATNASFCQTASTGALTGVTLDPAGARLADVTLTLVNPKTSETQSITSSQDGQFAFLLLVPGEYELQASKKGFEPPRVPLIEIHVTETLRLELRLPLAKHKESANVIASPLMVQTDSSSLGRVVNDSSVSDLPMVNRNFTQIAVLSPGVSSGVFNAGELGSGGTALSQIAKSEDGIYVHGARSYDNNWQMDGVSVSDVQGSAGASGGIPIPNPDSLNEFKVQTGLYDAAYGRFGGANISAVSKTGGNAFHGSIFEFVRNNVLNANDFFRNETGQDRADLKQNQFGFAFGGPIKKDKVLFFGSYQGTRQINALAVGQSRAACSASVSGPPLTDDRSAAAIGKLFGGMQGALGGVAVDPSGSNINPVALALLNLKLPNGNYLIPTPQKIDSSRPFASQGFSVFAEPCSFNDDQFMANVDYLISPKSRIAGRFFLANSDQIVTFPGNGLNPSGNTPGFPSPGNSQFVVFSLAHTYQFANGLLNEARIGYVRTLTGSQANAAFHWSDVGVSEGEMNNNNELPSLNILGSTSIASGFPRTIAQNTFSFSDNLSFLRGPHSVRIGGSVTRLQDNLSIDGVGSFLQFLSWPDFLLGLDAAGNGTRTFSNVYASADIYGLGGRAYRPWQASAFAQDDYRVVPSLTLNLGLRYERMGQLDDDLGRNSSFDIAKADPNPPAEGSLAGYIVGSNFAGTLPPGVTRAGNTFANYGDGQNTIAPRIGFAWQAFPQTEKIVLRGGYGLYYSLPTGQAFFQTAAGAPFALVRLNVGQANSGATFQEPFPQPFPTPASFPLFTPYSPSSTTTIFSVAPTFRPSLIQQYSLNIQKELSSGWLLEVGYVGTRGLHLLRQRSLNQALSASPSDPIRGVTEDTVANIPLRVPILGIPPDSLVEMESEGSSWYNGLEASLTKRLSRGLQFLASYTFSKTLDTDGADINSTSSGNALTLGDQNSPGQRWGRASFDRTHRFVFSTTWSLPSPSRGSLSVPLGGWEAAAVVTIQSGAALTIADTNANNIFGISEDRAQLSGNCTRNRLVTSGSVQSKLNNYFNVACFTTPPVVGADGIGTTFGDSGTGIVNGPAQANLDLAISKSFALRWPIESGSLQFRAEFYNAFNHPQFSNPDTNFTSPTFGVISSTAVNPRVGQVALRFSF
jgi:Carboxypeptidase regulatory-like domain/TonB dependent receptor